MNTLKTLVRARLAAEPAASEANLETSSSPERALQIRAWNGEYWVLPWGYFYSAFLKTESEGECLLLRIGHYEVVVEGRRLRQLLPQIANFQVTFLRDVPGRFQVDEDKNLPFISRIAVRPVDSVVLDGAGTG